MSEIVIYEDGNNLIEISIENETLWLNAEEIATIFDVKRPAIVKHIGNIYKTNELNKDLTCSILEQVAKDGKKRKINLYNLDVIIATGYRVNSKKATAFRKWATNILQDYLIKGYSLNQKRLQQKGMKEFHQAVSLLQTTINQENLECDEAKGLLDVIVSYGRSWTLLEGYDENTLTTPQIHSQQKFILDYNQAKEAIAKLKKELMQKGEASELFGEAKSAHLLYYIIKDHPFTDGNKRIGAFLFILFLHKNQMLYRSNGEPKINDNALVALALMVAKSLPEQKDTVIALIENMLVEKES